MNAGPKKLVGQAALLVASLVSAYGALIPAANAEYFNLSDVSFCKLLTFTEIRKATGRAVTGQVGASNSCIWKLAPLKTAVPAKVVQGDEEIRIVARREDELPPTIDGLEGLTGRPLSEGRGAGELDLAKIDPGIEGVHAVCGFYLFSLEMRLTGIDYASVGRGLGAISLTRFNGHESRCFAPTVLPTQYPGLHLP